MLQFLIRLIWLVLVLLGVRLIFRAVARMFAASKPTPPKESTPGASLSQRGLMVRDPVCGTYVDPEIALASAHTGERHYFCSEECLRQFEREGNHP